MLGQPGEANCLFDHNFVAEVIKAARPANVEKIEYTQMSLGLIEVNIRFYVPKETLDKLLKLCYNETIDGRT